MNDLARKRLLLVLLSLTTLVTATLALAEDPSQLEIGSRKNTCYVSTGDRDWKVGLPVDSKATIEQVFEALATRYDVNRILWRGGQEEMWFKYYKFYEHGWNACDGYVKQVKYLRQKVGTSRIAREAARKRGMEFWLHTGLFCYGAPPDHYSEDPIRIQYPECVPVNRYGTRRQDGMIEYCHPQARAALVQRHIEFLVDNDYDGIVFYTYLENLSLRYMDEFGYNQPIVEEYKKRYGIDIRSEEFDKQAWGRIRGEYLTRFLRELKVALAKHGKKLAVCIDPKHTHLPQTHGLGAAAHTTTGRIHIDWEGWAKEGIVDELAVAYTGSSKAKLRTLKEIRQAVAGTDCRVSIWMQGGSLPPDVTPIIHAYGRKMEVAAAAVTDKGGKDVFVRRRALEAMGASKDPEAIPAIEAALRDPERSVRRSAALALGNLNGPESLEKLFDAIVLDSQNPHFIVHCAIPSLIKMARGNVDAVVAKLVNRDVQVRHAAIRVLQSIGGPDYPGAQSALLRVISNDIDSYARQLALSAATRYGDSPQVIAAMMEALKDQDEIVQVRAAESLARILAPAESPKEARRKALKALVAFFRQYGDGCGRSDANWGWRRVGSAILAFRPDGIELLKPMVEQSKDRRLAELAWRVVYLRPRRTRGEFAITEEQDKEAHSHRPVFDSSMN